MFESQTPRQAHPLSACRLLIERRFFTRPYGAVSGCLGPGWRGIERVQQTPRVIDGFAREVLVPITVRRFGIGFYHGRAFLQGRTVIPVHNERRKAHRLCRTGHQRRGTEVSISRRLQGVTGALQPRRAMQALGGGRDRTDVRFEDVATIFGKQATNCRQAPRAVGQGTSSTTGETRRSKLKLARSQRAAVRERF